MVAAEGEWRNRQPEMRYRKLGRTGFMISEIVCGGDPISPTNNRHVELAIEMGLNYLDTAPEYGEGASERGYSGIIQGSKRDRVFVNTKVRAFPASRFGAYKMVFAMKTAQVIFEPERSTTPVPERAALLNQTIPGDMGLHQKAYRFVLNNPHVSAVISQMADEKQVRENLPVARA